MSRLWIGAASVTGGEVKMLAQKRPIATAREAASKVSLFRVIVPSCPETTLWDLSPGIPLVAGRVRGDTFAETTMCGGTRGAEWPVPDYISLCRTALDRLQDAP
jgi:hypothetical protein